MFGIRPRFSRHAFFRLCLGLLVTIGITSGRPSLGTEPLKPPGGSLHGILVNGAGAPIYGFSNLKLADWLGIKVLHANFVILDSKVRPIGNVALIPTSTPGVYVWISDQGPRGVVQAVPGGATWRDAPGGSGKYVPL
jgi:hypothetical protein